MLDPIRSPALSALPGIAHGFFTRDGGCSAGVYGALNCGPGSADARHNVIENRARVASHLGTTADRLLTAYQIHSATAVVVERAWALEDQPKADALVTGTRGIALGALAADCAPVLFADPRAGVIAAAHAGWKGALGGVIEATVVAMEGIGARRPDIVAALGPCIGRSAYEVGPEFRASFLAVAPEFAGYFTSQSHDGRPFFDLPAFVLGRLSAAGVGSIENSSQCTYAYPERFFSFRRMTHLKEVDYGRQISAVLLA